jgi:hypothetical protein
MTPTVPSPTAVEKRAANAAAMAPFALDTLRAQLPLTFPCDPTVPPSSKPRYRSHYSPRAATDLTAELLATGTPFELWCHLFDYRALEPLLAAHLYAPSAKGQTPFHPVSMYLLSLYRREHHLARQQVLDKLQHPEEGQLLRRCTGFTDAFPTESGLRYFEQQLTPPLQQEILALQLDMLYQAGLLPLQPGDDGAAPLAFDGMLHAARSRMRCSTVQASCYQPAPRACPAQAKQKQGCNCDTAACAQHCRHAPARDPDARFIVYTGDNKRADASPNASVDPQPKRARAKRWVYGYYSYAGQLLDDARATYWILPAAFGPATTGDATLFPDLFADLQARFPWLQISEVLADAAAGVQPCLDAIWDAGALRMVDLRAHESDADPATCLARGYNADGHPLCPHGYVLRPNGHDYHRRQTKWRCAHRCRHDPQRALPDCPYLAENAPANGYTTALGRTHADGSMRLAREIPYGTPAWDQRYGRRNCAESRNGSLERLGLKRMPIHGLPDSHVCVLQGDFLTNQRTLLRLVREATAQP